MAQIENFEPQPPSSNRQRWIWCLYLVVGAFIIALLIWMFVALSKHQEDMQMQEQSIYNTEMPADTVAPPLPPSQL